MFSIKAMFAWEEGLLILVKNLKSYAGQIIHEFIMPSLIISVAAFFSVMV